MIVDAGYVAEKTAIGAPVVQSRGIMFCRGGTLDINVSEVVEFDDATSVSLVEESSWRAKSACRPDSLQTVSLGELTLPGGGPFGGKSGCAS